MARDDLAHPLRHLEDLLRGDLDVGGRAAEPARALMDHHLGVGKDVTLPGGAAAEDHRAGRHRHPDRVRRDVRMHELHRVVDRHAGVRRSARRVDVQRDVLAGILRVEEQELCRDQVRDLILDLLAEENDPLAQQTRVDVERALEASVLLHHHRYERHVTLLVKCNLLVALSIRN